MCLLLLSVWSSFIWTKTVWSTSFTQILILCKICSLDLSLMSKCLFRTCVAFFWVINRRLFFIISLCYFLEVTDLICASGGNKIEDLASIDSLNAFPKLVVRCTKNNTSQLFHVRQGVCNISCPCNLSYLCNMKWIREPSDLTTHVDHPWKYFS